ncbi:MAG: hypothetical protein QGG26_14930, partial [Candidatus Undinarchaeales archaeon]|nr:hypothetical protein [Candidatus Undinarchaeales archaeon]
MGGLTDANTDVPIGANRPRLTLLLLLVFLVVAQPALGADDEIILDTLPFVVRIALVLLWAAVFYVVFLYCGVLYESVRSPDIPILCAGTLLFVLGLLMLQTGMLATPPYIMERLLEVLPPHIYVLKMVLLLAIIGLTLMFLREWARVFMVAPILDEPGYIPYAAASASLLINAIAIMLPYVYNPVIQIHERILLFPVVGGGLFIILAGYYTLTGLLVARETPVLRRFIWIIAETTLMTVFLILFLTETLWVPANLRGVVFPHTIFYSYVGFALILIGYVLKVRSLVAFSSTFIAREVARSTGTKGDTTLFCRVMDRLVDYFEDVPALLDALKKVGVRTYLTFRPADRRFTYTGHDLTSFEMEEVFTKAFFASIELATSSHPPVTRGEVDEDRLKADITDHLGDDIRDVPLRVRSYLLPETKLMELTVTDTMKKLLEILSLTKGMSGVLMRSLGPAFPRGTFSLEDEFITFDPAHMREHILSNSRTEDDFEQGLSTAYLRFYRIVLTKGRGLLSIDRLRSILETVVSPYSTDKLYAATGIPSLLANGLFAKDHPWGYTELDEAAGRIQNNFAVLLAHTPDFPKEDFLSRFISGNINEYRNVILVSHIKPAVLTTMLGPELEAEQLMDEDRLCMLLLDPNQEDMVTERKNVVRINTSF